MTDEEKQGLLKNICVSDEEKEEYMNEVTNDSIQSKQHSLNGQKYTK